MIKTERLILRPLKTSDYEALYAVLADSDMMRHYPYTFDEKRVRGWIARNMEREATFGFSLWAMALRETGEVIGDCGVTMQNINGVIRPEAGYHVRRDRQRKGYAVEAARGACAFVFDHTPFGAIYSYMHADNVPSYSVAVKNGFRLTEEYVSEDGFATRVYRVTREEWDALYAGRKLYEEM